MKSIRILTSVLIIFTLLNESAFAQDPVESITAAELRNHIFFLASDYMNGRVGTSAEYEIAAQYVASQFRAAGLEPLATDENGKKSFFQGVPFSKTTYKDELSWNLTKDGKDAGFKYIDDFKILYGDKLGFDNLEIAYAGYGIEEPDHKWNDFKNLDVQGKIMICLAGAPVKNGKPVLPQDVHSRYVGPMGIQSKVMGLFSKGAEAIIISDVDGSGGMPYEMIPSSFSTEKYIYKSEGNKGRSRSIPSIFLAKPEIINKMMKGNKSNPAEDPENIMKNYKPQLLKDTYLSSIVEVLNEETIYTKNVLGIVEGTDPELKDEYIVVGAHLDHVRPVNGQVCNGADDNASGSSGVIEIAEAVAMNPCKRSVIFITYTAEEMGLVGSRHFVGSDIVPLEQIKFNLNMDMIGRSDPEHKEDRAHYVVTNRKYVDELESFISGLNEGITDFPLIFDNDEESPGGSDHQTFINLDIPAFFFFSGVHEDLHQPGDDPEKIDYAKAVSICRLGYLITDKLANMATVPTFE